MHRRWNPYTKHTMLTACWSTMCRWPGNIPLAGIIIHICAGVKEGRIFIPYGGEKGQDYKP